MKCHILSTLSFRYHSTQLCFFLTIIRMVIGLQGIAVDLLKCIIYGRKKWEYTTSLRLQQLLLFRERMGLSQKEQ